ncbi:MULTISPECIES: TetR/AcrR family transcriptional regulator [unclassified Pseudoclavibacter]|uniref:TetR/AcrR family transcriptional regulator n=1 Tax=unclassified Pseudoclavibacter TaxID=2615177 RepID=UPI001BA83542|nr:TetR/AcrR family transcriptional regulator [Pseudoclavibacter sp. Marseille-Q4354]MBS3178869.1 TetR/AcrR family transcriptional regulator [Pseudoclavibacter sp. Marseille-Q4354]
MDPRQARTRSALRAAIYELAAAQPIADVSVAQVARAAGITRDTFYRHATTPEHLLADFLGEEIDALMAPIANLPATSGTELSVFDEPERELLRHVARHAQIYLNAMAPRLTGPVRDTLVDRVEAGLLTHLERHPEIAPPAQPGIDDERHRRILVAYAGSGTVSAIEEWLRSGELGDVDGDVDAAASTIIAASPDWWLGRSRS